MSILLYILNSLFGLAIHFFFCFWYCQTDLWSFNMNPLKLHLKVLFALTFENQMNLKKNNLYCKYANSRLIHIYFNLNQTGRKVMQKERSTKIATRWFTFFFPLCSTMYVKVKSRSKAIRSL
jgi:hypothetical protein